MSIRLLELENISRGRLKKKSVLLILPSFMDFRPNFGTGKLTDILPPSLPPSLPNTRVFACYFSVVLSLVDPGKDWRPLFCLIFLTAQLKQVKGASSLGKINGVFAFLTQIQAGTMFIYLTSKPSPTQQRHSGGDVSVQISLLPPDTKHRISFRPRLLCLPKLKGLMTTLLTSSSAMMSIFQTEQQTQVL